MLDKNPIVNGILSSGSLLMISGFPPASVLSSMRATSVRAKRRKARITLGPGVRELPCVTPFFGGYSGAVCISIDFELAWGRRISDPHTYRLYSILGRRNTGHIVSMLNQFDIPATWATVGHLILAFCERDQRTGVAHVDIPRVSSHSCPCWSFVRGDWYEDDPCTSLLEDPWWYARDLVLTIVKSPRHELATHSFSHVDFGSCPDSVARSEIDACRHLVESLGSSLKSMVFPCNRVGKLEILRDAGLIAYRGYSGEDAVQYPVRTDGLWDIHQTIQIVATDPYSKDDAIQYARDAINSGGVCHLWFHEYDISIAAQSKLLSPILSFCTRERGMGRLWVSTMSEIANYCETRANSSVRVSKRHPLTLDLSVDPLDARFTPSELTLAVPKGEPPIVNGVDLSRSLFRSDGNIDYYNIRPCSWTGNRTGEISSL
jgi:hypothetical protein